MKRLAVGFVCWLVGLFASVVLAGVLFVIAALVAGTAPQGSTFGLMLTLFGLVVFPFVLVLGTTGAGQVIRRALFALGLEGVVMLGTAYTRLTGLPLLDSSRGSWGETIQEVGRSIAQLSPVIAGVGGVALLALSVLLSSALAKRARSAKTADKATAPAQALTREMTEPLAQAVTEPAPHVATQPQRIGIHQTDGSDRSTLAWRLGKATRRALSAFRSER